MSSALWDGPVVDVDVHAQVPSAQALYPYLDEMWVEFSEETGFGRGAPGGVATYYPPSAPTTVDARWVPADGRPPASDVDLLGEHVLDPWRTETAVVNCWWGVESVRHPEFSAALAAAVNDWVAAEWLDRDPRLRASITVPGRDPVAMAREIDRVGSHPGFVQVLLPVRSDRLYGNRVWHPLYDALGRNGLAAALHLGGFGDGPSTPTGWPSWYLEEHVGAVQLYVSQLISMVAEGVFELYPQLRVAVLEGGFAWVPSAMWRMDKEWKGLRRDIPWAKRAPSATLREHVRFAVQPIDAGPPEEMARILDWLGSDEMLMFSTDYPHAHVDEVDDLLALLSEPTREKLMNGNARTFYGL